MHNYGQEKRYMGRKGHAKKREPRFRSDLLTVRGWRINEGLSFQQIGSPDYILYI